MARLSDTEAFYDATGRFSAGAWLEYWTRVWGDQWPPAVYLDRTRMGVLQLGELSDALLQEIDRLREESGVTGTPAADPWRTTRETVVEVRNSIASYWAPLATSVTTKPAAQQLVTRPLLTRPDAPLMRLGQVIGSVEQGSPLRSWTEIAKDVIDEHVTGPLGGAVAAASGGLTRIFWIGALALVVYLAWRSGLWRRQS